MRRISDLSQDLVSDLRAKGADIERTLAVLELIDPIDARSEARTPSAEKRPRLPEIDDPRLSQRRGERILRLNARAAAATFTELELPLSFDDVATRDGADVIFSELALKKIGILLYPRVAYGVLNGGSATTYIDEKKNRELDPGAFSVLEKDFVRAAEASRDMPKGTTSAFLGEDGDLGPSFLVLKMRGLLVQALKYRILSGDEETPLLPFFQMTSLGTDARIREAYGEYRKHPLLAELIDRAGIDPTAALGAIQPMLAAITHSSEGLPRRVFDRAGGERDKGLALPGGHGENFRVLAKVYSELRARGVRWAYLGNVDNSGYTVDPVSVATIALRGSQAAFEFSWKTKVDVKGGVLVEQGDGRLSVADIGQALSREELAAEEALGKKALFNCATGLFNLDYLVPRLGAIADGLPIRVSDQDKGAGRYAQAEQTTWEVLGLMDDPLIIAVEKSKRFLAAKTLMETLLASPVGKKIEADPSVPQEIKSASALLRGGLGALLESEYGFSTRGAGSVHGQGPHRPLAVEELENRLKEEL